jgi:hypothetical protein
MEEESAVPKLIECPQEKIHLTGVEAGQTIMVPVNKKGEGTCPMLGICKTPCKFNK